MKKILTLLHLILISNFLFAQWFNGTNIYNTNTGNVGIGVTSPAAKLEIVNAGNASLRVGIVGNRANTHVQIANSMVVLGDNNSSIASNGAV
ncbi:MAG TPA: hypothetical protein VJU78_18435, partial [Chitinophagaceae bacterium]|nr:hypothetical protein [Chitinophagaceae bacterium]